MPLTASSPIEPPGKRMGLTTKLSVVIASCVASTSTAPASASSSSASEPKAGTSTPSMSDAVALPPAPCAIVMRSSRNFGRLARAVSMMPRIRVCSRSVELGRAADVTYTTSRSRAKRP